MARTPNQKVTVSAFRPFTFLPRNLKLRTCSWVGTIALVLVFCPWLSKGVWDAYVGYSGKVVAKGNYLWVPFRGVDWYIILEDSSGHRTKRYVNAYGYAYCDLGSFVVKKKGFGKFPRRPGELRPSEFESLVKQKQQSQK